MPRSPETQYKFAARFIKGALLLWLVLVAAFAAWMFLATHGATFAPEIGPTGTFVVFVVLYSLPYAIAVLAIFFLAVLISGRPRDDNGA